MKTSWPPVIQETGNAKHVVNYVRNKAQHGMLLYENNISMDYATALPTMKLFYLLTYDMMYFLSI